MLWRKAWLECRYRFLLCYFMSLSVTFAALVRPPKPWEQALAAAAIGGEERLFRVVFGLLAVMVVPVGALILAGSGINTQTSWGMTHGFHPSMYFLLSMPVTREQLLRIRVLMGLGLLFVWTVTTAGVVLLSTQWGKLAMDPGRVFATLPNLLVGAVLFYAFSVFLTAFLDEYWAGMTALLVMGMLGGYGVAEGPGGANLLAYMMSQSLVAGDLEAWAKAGIFLAISAAFYLAAWRVVAAKEY